MSTSSELAVLLKKYIEGSILPVEQQLLEDNLSHDPLLREYVDKLLQGDTLISEYEDWLAARKLMNNHMLESIKSQTFKRIHQDKQLPVVEVTSSSRRKFIHWLQIAASAAAAICLFTGVWYIYQQSSTESNLTSSRVDLSPAINNTTLTLSNGEQIELRGDQQGIMLTEGLNYTDGSAVTSLNLNELNKLNATIHVPKGSMYRVILADGSHVILNAMSTLTYPLAFNQDSREVTLSGEGYFDIVKKNQAGKRIPFTLHTAQQQVSVK